MKQGWEISNIGSVCDIRTGRLDANASSENGAYPFFTCSKECLRIDDYAYDCECVLIAGNGDLNVKYYKGKFNAYQRTYIITLKTNVNNISVKYIFKFFEKYVERLRQLSVGGVIKYIKLGDLTNAKLPIPSLAEQEKIVAELDCLFGIIEKKKQQLKEYDALAQSIFYEMFGNPIDNEKGWETNSLGEIANISSGGTPSRKKTEYFTGNINWYSAGELNNLYLPDSIEKITEEAINNSAAKVFKANSLMVGMYDTAAFKLGILRKDSASNQACANIDLHSDNVVWMYYLLSLMKEEALKHRHGIRQKNLNVGFIKSFVVPLPPIALQQEFASKIEAIEKQKELIKQSIAETETLFNSRMDYYFN